MRADHDAMLLVRADLCERLDRLRGLAGRLRRRDMAESVEGIRLTAAAYGLIPVVRLAEAIQRGLQGPDADATAGLYLDRLSDAIGCERLDDDAAQAMLASVSVRLAG